MVEVQERAEHAPRIVLQFLGGLRRGWTYQRISRFGLAATIVITISSYGAGALPANDPTRHIPVIGLLRHGWLGLHVALALFYFGLMALILAWLMLGRLLLTGAADGKDATTREQIDPGILRRTLIKWMTPLLFGMPLASMDLYSYSAQAQLARLGRDPYTFTPADLPGRFLDNVAWKWVDTPSPYGPLWVTVSRWVATVTGDHALISVLVLRLLPFAAIVVTAWMLPGLARRFGGRPDIALWIAIANPLVLIHGVGGGHNDAVMVAFVIAGLTVVLQPNASWYHLAGGAGLMALAAAVKAPGAVAVAFVVPIYLAGRYGLRVRDWVGACLIAAAAAIPVYALITWLVGYGNGWTKQLSPAIPVVSFLSIPTILAVGYNLVSGAPHPGTVVDHIVRLFRQTGSAVSATLLAVFWFRSVRGGAVQMLALALTTVVLLSPAVQPWYFTWGLTVAALFLMTPRQLSWIAAGSVALTLLIRPMGAGLELAPYVPAVLIAGLVSRTILGPAVDHVRHQPPEGAAHHEPAH
ncbi:MAG TPA: polyprenol phosphomannose-dependent alpha 1,6 mannosyltransferase MptB [Jatrophihabitans sp.]|jgi:alpha-1,6-mannosyltransferase